MIFETELFLHIIHIQPLILMSVTEGGCSEWDIKEMQILRTCGDVSIALFWSGMSYARGRGLRFLSAGRAEGT